MPPSVDKLLDRAKRYLEKNKVEDAVEAYQAVLTEQPNQLEALQSLGDLYTRRGDPDRAATYYASVFDHLYDAREETKAVVLYSRALRGVPQPPERMARYALLLQRQNRVEDAIEQYSAASELFQSRGQQEPALECIERVSQLDSENPDRHRAVGQLAEKLGKTAIASRALLRAGQLLDTSGEAETGLQLLARGHLLAPGERGPALVYAQALLHHGRAAQAAEVLEPFASGELDAGSLTTLGDALMGSGSLDRARTMFERLPPERPGTTIKLFELTKCYLAVHGDAEAVALLQRIKQFMLTARQESEFAAQLDALVADHPHSLVLAEFWAGLYAQLNRETKYFDALVRLFDLYLEAGNLQGSCDALEKLIEIDPYDARNQQRLQKMEGRADPSFIAQIRGRLSQVATHVPEPAPMPVSSAPSPADVMHDRSQQHLEEFMVQAEIFVQYGLQAKAVEQLKKIAEMFPGEEERNERLRKLYQVANWWPPSSKAAPAPAAPAESSRPAGGAAPDPASTMRDLARISEISQSLFRLTSPRAILSAAIQQIGQHLGVTRCLAVIGLSGKPLQLAAEFHVPGKDSTPASLLVRLMAQIERAAPDALGGLPLDAAAAPVLREMGLGTALGVVLADPETKAQAGMVIAGHAAPHSWRAHETYFLQAVGDQMLLGIHHNRLRALARTVGAADEKTGLLARSAYLDCLLNEAQRAKSRGAALSLALIQIDKGAELLAQHGEPQIERHMEQLARVFGPAVRQSDLTVKYTSWAIAFILPDTALAGARTLVDKLREAGGQAQPPWDGTPANRVTLSASIAEAVARPDFDPEDIVTELINRAEAGLEEARHRGGDTVITLSSLAVSHPAPGSASP